MKTKMFFFFICIFSALVKVSLLEEDENPSNITDFICFGFDNYKANTTNITFKALFQNLSKKNMTKYFEMNANITYLTNNNISISYDKEQKITNCTIENTKLNDDFIYYNCFISNPNISNITNITLWRRNADFGGEVVPGYLILDPMFNLVEFTKELYIFNLTEEIEEKHGQFILKGNMHKNLNDNEEFKIEYNDMKGAFSCENKRELFYECKISPTSLIENRTIEQRTADSSKSKIIISARFLENINITYPKNATIDNPNEKNATIISIGNFNDNEYLKDAIGKIYMKCRDYSLKYLKEFIRFYVEISYNPRTNLRMLESKEQIEVIGKKNLSEISKGIVSYDLTYMNTTNKKIENISSPSNISFSDSNTFIGENNEMNIQFNKDENYQFLEKEEKKYESMFLKKNKNNYDANINSDSFSFGFDTQDDILNVEDNAEVEVSYIPSNEERYFDKCKIKKSESKSYNIICSPKRSVNALMNTLRIDITNLLKKRRLSSVSVRILEDATNTTLIPDLDSVGVIKYLYYPKNNSKGLSGAEIAILIIATIAAILAVLYLFFFLNRRQGSRAKNNDVISIPLQQIKN